jgi:hypothetical protein
LSWGREPLSAAASRAPSAQPFVDLKKILAAHTSFKVPFEPQNPIQMISFESNFYLLRSINALATFIC